MQELDAIPPQDTEAIPAQSIGLGNVAPDPPKNPDETGVKAELLPSLMPSAMPREDAPIAAAESVPTGKKRPVIDVWGDLMETSKTDEEDTDETMSPEPSVISEAAVATTEVTADSPSKPVKAVSASSTPPPLASPVPSTAAPDSQNTAENPKVSNTDLPSDPIKATSASSKYTMTTAFCATSRKAKGGKRNAATAVLDKFLRQKLFGRKQAQPIAGSHPAKPEIANEARITGRQDEARTTARRANITDLPNEIIEAIAKHLRPPYEPIEEMSTVMRVCIWEQDDIFYPHWGKDLFGLAATCKRFRKLLYDRNRYGCIQVADSEEALKSMVKNMPREKRELVRYVDRSHLIQRLISCRAIIIGNAIYVHEDAVTPYYLEALAAFPNLTAIQHRPCNEMDAFRFPAEPFFQYRPLDSLDICVPDLMCETPFPPPDKFVSTKVKSFTMRENNWWMLYNGIHAGPQGGRCREYFDNMFQHFTGIERLNLFPILVHEQTPFPEEGTSEENSATWITLKNLPEVRTLNVRFDMAHKFRTEDVASLVSRFRRRLKLG